MSNKNEPLSSALNNCADQVNAFRKRRRKKHDTDSSASIILENKLFSPKQKKIILVVSGPDGY